MSLTAELQSLAALKAQGTLTEQEFAQAKAEVIAKYGGTSTATPVASKGFTYTATPVASARNDQAAQRTDADKAKAGAAVGLVAASVLCSIQLYMEQSNRARAGTFGLFPLYLTLSSVNTLGLRSSCLEGVLLADARLGHGLGRLLVAEPQVDRALLREAQRLLP